MVAKGHCCVCGKEAPGHWFGAPPTCDACRDIIIRHEEAVQSHRNFIRQVHGLQARDLGDLTKNNNINQEILDYAEAISDVKMDIHYLESRLINLAGVIRAEIIDEIDCEWKPDCYAAQVSRNHDACLKCPFAESCSERTAENKQKKERERRA